MVDVVYEDSYLVHLKIHLEITSPGTETKQGLHTSLSAKMMCLVGTPSTDIALRAVIQQESLPTTYISLHHSWSQTDSFPRFASSVSS